MNAKKTKSSKKIVLKITMSMTIKNGSDEPDISERVQMVMEILRPTTAQMVLGQEALFLLDDHPLL